MNLTQASSYKGRIRGLESRLLKGSQQLSGSSGSLGPSADSASIQVPRPQRALPSQHPSPSSSISPRLEGVNTNNPGPPTPVQPASNQSTPSVTGDQFPSSDISQTTQPGAGVPADGVQTLQGTLSSHGVYSPADASIEASSRGATTAGTDVSNADRDTGDGEEGLRSEPDRQDGFPLDGAADPTAAASAADHPSHTPRGLSNLVVNVGDLSRVGSGVGTGTSSESQGIGSREEVVQSSEEAHLKDSTATQHGSAQRVLPEGGEASSTAASHRMAAARVGAPVRQEASKESDLAAPRSVVTPPAMVSSPEGLIPEISPMLHSWDSKAAEVPSQVGPDGILSSESRVTDSADAQIAPGTTSSVGPQAGAGFPAQEAMVSATSLVQQGEVSAGATEGTGSPIEGLISGPHDVDAEGVDN